MSDEDLDALLDDAMDMIDEHQREHEEAVRVRDAKLEQDLQKVLDESSGASGGDADMLKMFMSMLNGANGAGGVDDASLDSFKNSVKAMVSSLEGEGDLGEEEKANLMRVKELMNVMEEDDVDKANTLLDQMTKEGKLPEQENIGDADVAEASRRCMEMLQQLSDTAGHEVGNMQPPGPLPDTPVASSTATPGPSSAAPSAESQQASEALATALISTLTDPNFVVPIRLMRDSYEPYMAANRSTLSEEEIERYDLQRRKTHEICDLLQEPIKDAEDPRLVPLLELMNEYSELGEPPRDLVQYAPKKEGETADGPVTA